MPGRNARNAEKNLQLLEEMLNAGLWTYFVKTREVTWSNGMFRLVGLDPNVVQANFSLYESLLHPDDRLNEEQVHSLGMDVTNSTRRYRVIRPDGRMLWLQSTVERHFDRDGQLLTLQGVVIDVTNEEKLKTEWIREKSMAQSIRKLAGGSIWRAAPDGRLIETGDWAKLTGDTPEQARDWDSLSAIHPDDRATFRAAWKQGISTKGAVEFTIRVRRADQAYVQVINVALPILDMNGKILEWHGYSRIGQQPVVAGIPERGILAAHIRAARALLDWTAPQLAEYSGVSFSTIRRLEKDAGLVKPDSLEKVRDALERMGVTFSIDAITGCTVGLRRK